MFPYMKTQDTKIIEYVLYESLFGSNRCLAKKFGTTEVMLNDRKITNGKEFLDFLSFDFSKQTFSCYEIKISKQDFQSKAKKSWYGHYNYLVISETLFAEQGIEELKENIPFYVGIMVVNTKTLKKTTVKNAVKQNISTEQFDMLRNCLLRTLFYQNDKLRTQI